MSTSTIQIGNEVRDLKHASEDWIEHQIKRAQKHNGSVCVVVKLYYPPIDMILSTPGCSSSGGGGRQPNAKEREIFTEWNERGLDRDGWRVHDLINFLKHIKRYLD